jgi:hypothetical protein
MDITANNRVSFQEKNYNSWWQDLSIKVDNVTLDNLEYINGDLTILARSFSAPRLHTVTGNVIINIAGNDPQLDLELLRIVTKNLDIQINSAPLELNNLYQILGSFNKRGNTSIQTPNLVVTNNLPNFKPGQFLE